MTEETPVVKKNHFLIVSAHKATFVALLTATKYIEKRLVLKNATSGEDANECNLRSSSQDYIRFFPHFPSTAKIFYRHTLHTTVL